jgi:hypothetical protein
MKRKIYTENIRKNHEYVAILAHARNRNRPKSTEISVARQNFGRNFGALSAEKELFGWAPKFRPKFRSENRKPKFRLSRNASTRPLSIITITIKKLTTIHDKG